MPLVQDRSLDLTISPACYHWATAAPPTLGNDCLANRLSDEQYLLNKAFAEQRICWTRNLLNKESAVISACWCGFYSCADNPPMHTNDAKTVILLHWLYCRYGLLIVLQIWCTDCTADIMYWLYCRYGLLIVLQIWLTDCTADIVYWLYCRYGVLIVLQICCDYTADIIYW